MHQRQARPSRQDRDDKEETKVKSVSALQIPSVRIGVGADWRLSSDDSCHRCLLYGLLSVLVWSAGLSLVPPRHACQREVGACRPTADLVLAFEYDAVRALAHLRDDLVLVHRSRVDGPLVGTTGDCDSTEPAKRSESRRPHRRTDDDGRRTDRVRVCVSRACSLRRSFVAGVESTCVPLRSSSSWVFRALAASHQRETDDTRDSHHHHGGRDRTRPRGDTAQVGTGQGEGWQSRASPSGHCSCWSSRSDFLEPAAELISSDPCDWRSLGR